MTVTVLGAVGDMGPTEEALSKTKAFATRHGVVVQLVRADMVFDPLHLVVAAELARRSFEQGRNRSDDLGMELLLYCAAERQISVALERVGVTDHTEDIAIVIIGEAPDEELLSSLGLERNDEVLSYRPQQSYSTFGISEEEVEAVGEDRVPDLVLEKMALSELDR